MKFIHWEEIYERVNKIKEKNIQQRLNTGEFLEVVLLWLD